MSPAARRRREANPIGPDLEKTTMSNPEVEYIKTLQLPAALSRGPGDLATPPSFTTERQAVAIAGQLAEFSPAIDPGLRGDLSNCLLLAQLAADKAAGSPAQDVKSWYRTYSGVLKNTGWLVGEGDFQEQAVSADGVFVHKEIIPVLTAFLGPAASAVSIVVTMLNSLSAMQQNQPWITLFQSENQTLNGAKLQISLVDRQANGDAAVNLLSVGIEAAQRITQVLFFKVSRQSTRLSKATGTMTMSPATLARIRAAVQAKVDRHVFDNIANVDI
jgi:hypothetical protein